MKTFFSISLLTLFIGQIISPNMDICCELEKLPAIIHHFEHHQAENGDSFIEFLYKDLLSSEGREEGHHKDTNHDDFPFSGSHQCNHAPLAFLSFQLEDFTLFEYYETTKFGTYLSKSSQGYSESPFQPPKD